MINISELIDWADRQVTVADEILACFRTKSDIESNPKGYEYWKRDRELAEAAVEVFTQLARSEAEHSQYKGEKTHEE